MAKSIRIKSPKRPTNFADDLAKAIRDNRLEINGLMKRAQQEPTTLFGSGIESSRDEVLYSILDNLGPEPYLAQQTEEEDKELVEEIMRRYREKTRPSALVLESVIIPKTKSSEGLLIRSISLAWLSIVKAMSSDWSVAYQIPPRSWEEIIAGAYSRAGFDEVVLTPRSGDHGRDVIAARRGVGSLRILGSVKAFAPGHLVTKEEVHALMGVVALDQNASKGVFTTTSDFAPRLLDDPRLAAAVPYRLELMNGDALSKWLSSLIIK
jgi:restriction system protein